MRYGTPRGWFELNPFPGCNQLVISNHAFVHKSFRGTGIGQAAHQERLNTIKALGYDCAICTVREDNSVQIHILAKNGWTKVWEFFNRESECNIQIWVRSGVLNG